jgi:hypothetical protein
MGSYQMRHAVTGVLLAGYQVLDASDSEIQAANQRLVAAGNSYRLEPCPSTAPPQPSTLVADLALQ